MNKEKVLKYFTVLPIMIIGYLVFKQFLYYNEIDKNKSFTTGKVIKFTEDIRSYWVYYEYIINKKKYTGVTSVRNLKKFKNNITCTNCVLKVIYSSKDPSKSSLRLGKYEKYKTKVEFVNLDDWNTIRLASASTSVTLLPTKKKYKTIKFDYFKKYNYFCTTKTTTLIWDLFRYNNTTPWTQQKKLLRHWFLYLTKTV